LLGFSGVVSLDIDHVEHSRTVLTAFNIDLDELAETTPRIIGNPAKFRLMFSAPAALELVHKTLSWPQPEDLRKGFAVLELRAGPVSDALPPTTHVGTRKPYRWAIPPRDGFPPLPESVLALWQDWPNFEREARALCPWAPPPPDPAPSAKPARSADEPSVIFEFNAQHDVASILAEHGYKRRGKRFVAPDSSHAPGLILLESGRVRSYHAGDVLGGGKARDAFDVWATLVHGGNVTEAVKAAAKLLGLDQQRRT
jgi:putative DNA primase/helicase